EAQLVPVVANGVQSIGSPVEPRFHAGTERQRDITLDVQRLIEIGFEQTDMTEQPDAELRGRCAKSERGSGRAFPILKAGTVGEVDAEADTGALAQGAQRTPGNPQARRCGAGRRDSFCHVLQAPVRWVGSQPTDANGIGFSWARPERSTLRGR